MKKTFAKNWFTVALSIIGLASPILLNNMSNEMGRKVALKHHRTLIATQVGAPAADLAAVPDATPVASDQDMKQTDTLIAQTPPIKNTFLASAREYTYTFAGQATFDGRPCPNARVEIRVTSEYGADIHQVTTGPDGRYSLAVPVTGKPNETLSWEIHALTPDYKEADLEGHQILREEPSIQMNNSLNVAEI